MGGGRRFFLPYSTPDPESGSNTHYGRRDGRDLIKVRLNLLITKWNLLNAMWVIKWKKSWREILYMLQKSTSWVYGR